jgi:phosphomannomutase/phosphoglucomutase
MLSIFAEFVLKKGKGPVVFDVKCSLTLIEKIEQMGGEPVMWQTGYPLIQSKMRETGARLAGEMSGHMYFADRYFGFDDGIYAAARLAEIVSNTGKSLNDFAADLPAYPATPELRLHCPEEAKFSIPAQVAPKIKEGYEIIHVDGLRFTTPDGWGLIRVSNTEPAVVVRFEARDNGTLKAIIADALEALGHAPVEKGELERIYERL